MNTLLLTAWPFSQKIWYLSSAYWNEEEIMLMSQKSYWVTLFFVTNKRFLSFPRKATV